MHVYMPWWLHDKKDKEFPRGYHIEIGGGFGMPQIGSFHGDCQRMRATARAQEGDPQGLRHRRCGFAGRGEMIPNEHTFCEIDPDTVDQCGIPVLRFHFRGAEHEIRQAKHMHDTFAQHHRNHGRQGDRGSEIRSAKQKAFRKAARSFTKPARCGWATIPKKSALNKYSQAHEVKNLFVADAAPFVSQPDKNVTLSIIAFAWRTSEYLAEEMRKGNV